MKRDRPPTIVDVAKEANVAVMSVSRVINNYPSVKSSTRAKVMKAIAKIGYTPNDAARMLKGRTGRTIALVVPDLSDFFASCFHAVQDVAMRHGYQTLVVATGRSRLVEDQQLESIQSHRIAGLLIVTSGSDGRRLKMLQDSGIPVVALDRPVAGLQADAVLVENREGVELGVRHLIDHGHERIACVASIVGATLCVNVSRATSKRCAAPVSSRSFFSLSTPLRQCRSLRFAGRQRKTGRRQYSL